MRNTVRRAVALYALIIAFFGGLGFLGYTYVTHGKTYVTKSVNSHLYTNRILTTAGSVFDRNGKVLVTTKDSSRVFSSDITVRKATLHSVGDTAGYISTGIQKIYRSYLIGYDFVNGVYKTIKDGTGNDITMTIDSEICKTAYDALGSKGTVAVYNYKTGEIVCAVSKPSYDPMNVPSDLGTNTELYDAVYINRLLSGVFTPGSTFKVVTAMSALENMQGLGNRTFTCTGSYTTKDGGKVICNGVHGTVTFRQALNKSCNSVFAQLAEELGKKKLTATAEELGFNKTLSACGVTLTKSSFSLKKATKTEIGWAGIGQGKTLANPCHMLMIMGAIANGGQAVTPVIVNDTSTNKIQEFIGSIISTDSSQITISPELASSLKELLRSDVSDNYGDWRFPGLEMCGKTGTAEIDGKQSHAWFVGFSQRSDLPFAIVVVSENGGSSTSAALPVVSKVMAAVDDKF